MCGYNLHHLQVSKGCIHTNWGDDIQEFSWLYSLCKENWVVKQNMVYGMGNYFSCCYEKKHEVKERLLQDVYCPICKRRYMSNYEYNKHIVWCNESYGDM